jgi:hypothetical protein
MSSAFVKEGDSEQLRDVPPNLTALLYYLRRENGTTIYELRREHREKYGREVYEMSDGLGYMLNDENQWQIVLD